MNGRWLGTIGLALVLAPLVVSAQTAPAKKPTGVEERPVGAEATTQVHQIRATMAYREVQQAAFEAKLAEQDVLNTQSAYDTTRARADALKVELDKAIKARDAAKAKEAAARKRYDEALQAVPR